MGTDGKGGRAQQHITARALAATRVLISPCGP